MNSKQRRTLEAIFRDPVAGTIAWREIESLFLALGAVITEGNGSRVRFELNGLGASFHRPHPRKETKHYAVRNVRAFLIAAGVKP